MATTYKNKKELAELERELASLKAELSALQRGGFTNFKVVFPKEAAE